MAGEPLGQKRLELWSRDDLPDRVHHPVEM